MKTILFLLISIFSLQSFADCEKNVIGHYKAVFHATYKAARNTFLNNFVGRKNMFAHTFGEPRIAFENLTIMGENYIAARIVEKSGRNGREVYETYMELLRSDKLCQDLGEDYKNPRVVRKYLLEQLGAE